MTQAGMAQFNAETYAVPPFGPSSVQRELILLIKIVDGAASGIAGGADGGVVAHVEPRPAAIFATRTVGAGNSQVVRSKVLAKTRGLRGGIQICEAEVRIDNQVWPH